jgi:phage baseplate assembly protein W
MVDKIKTAILYYEPRIDVKKIDMVEDEMLEGKILIEIEYIVRSTNSRLNFVYPFYKGEATEVNDINTAVNKAPVASNA